MDIILVIIAVWNCDINICIVIPPRPHLLGMTYSCDRSAFPHSFPQDDKFGSLFVVLNTLLMKPHNRNRNLKPGKMFRAPTGVPGWYLAAAAVIVVAAVPVIAAAIAAAVAAAAAAAVAQQQDQNDDPPPIVVQASAQRVIIVTHKPTSRKFN